ncbi:hypothetical protein IIA16_05475, partial [bacterium]|nr:hypothetical protein [bacterium]
MGTWLTISDDPEYDYGDTPVGASRVRTFTVTNSGVATAIAMVGGGLAAPFTFKGGAYPGTGGDCGATLGFAPPTNTCEMVVEYTPVAEVVSTDTITIDHDDGLGAAQATRDVRGTGIGGGVLKVPDVFLTIQLAIDGAAPGNIILVGQGTYFECIDFIGKDVLVIAGNPDPTLTIIDCGNADTAVKFVGGETLAAELSGFTVKNGSNPGGDGGGVRITNSSPTLTGNIITNNAASRGAGIAIELNSTPDLIGNIVSFNIATNRGGGIWVEGGNLLTAPVISAPLFCDNQIKDNLAPRGAGMAIEATKPGDKMLAALGGSPCWADGFGGNTFDNNLATLDGAGLWISGAGADGLIEDNLFFNNGADGDGGGIYVGAGAAPDILGNDIRRNEADKDITGAGDGGGVFITGAGTDPVLRGNSFGIMGVPASGNSAQAGGGIAITSGANPTIGGPVPGDTNLIVRGTAGVLGGGIWVTAAGTDPLVLNNDISENASGGDGGGFAVTLGASPSLGGPGPTDGNRILANNATGDGGGVFVASVGSNPAILGNSIGFSGEGNTAKNGAGIGVVAGAKPTIGGPGPTDGNQIFSNVASINGGGVFASGAGSDPTILGNGIGSPGQGNAATKGGGISFEAGAAPTIGGPGGTDGNIIDSNTATSDGAGIYAGSAATTNIQNNNIIANASSAFGGGITIEGAGVATTFFGNTVNGNSAVTAGGGIDISNGADPIIGGVGLANTIQGNTAGDGAGAFIFGLGTDPTVDANIIQGNTATADGGGIVVLAGAMPLIIGNTFEANNAGALGGGGGIAVKGSGTDPIIKGNTIGSP